DGDWDAVGIHSWRPPGTTVGTGDQSNHRSATCIDINGHLHPYERTVLANGGTYRDGFTQAQRDKVRAICWGPRDSEGRRIGRSGLDFARGSRDGMHLEIAPGVTRVQVQQAAKRLEDEVGRSSTADVMFRNAYGHDVRTLQNTLAEKRFKITSADAKFGPETEAAVRELQKVTGITVDGRFGPQARAALANYQPPQPKPTPVPEPEPQPTVDLTQYRVAGPIRFGTAALAALDQYPAGADTVTIAPAWAEVDQAIAAGYQDGPVLLS